MIVLESARLGHASRGGLKAQVRDIGSSQELEPVWYAIELAVLGEENAVKFTGMSWVYGTVGITKLLKISETVVLCTDESWKCHKSAVVASEFCDGEVHDMREESLGRKTPDFYNSNWGKVEILEFLAAKLVLPDTLPVRVTQEFKPIAIIKSPNHIIRINLLVQRTQTAHSLAVTFDLFLSSLLLVAAKSLGRQVRALKFRIATGFDGTPVICHALTKTGETDLAYRMILEKY